jgi:hypothetical protein
MKNWGNKRLRHCEERRGLGSDRFLGCGYGALQVDGTIYVTKNIYVSNKKEDEFRTA